MNKNNKNLKKLIAIFWNQQYDAVPEKEVRESWLEFRKEHLQSNNSNKIFHLITAISSVAAAIFLGFLVFNTSDISENAIIKTNYCIVENVYGKVIQITLPDSSLVTMQKNSRIKYAEDFTEKREIFYEGEGFFQIVKNEKKPLVVETNGVVTTVLGTTFKISEDSNNSTIIELFEGKVNVNYKTKNEKWVLKPGEKIKLDGTEASISTFDNVFYNKSKHIDLNHIKVKELIDYLENRYGYSIKLASNINVEETVTLRISDTDSLKSIVKTLSKINKSKLIIYEEKKEISIK